MATIDRIKGLVLKCFPNSLFYERRCCDGYEGTDLVSSSWTDDQITETIKDTVRGAWLTKNRLGWHISYSPCKDEDDGLDYQIIACDNDAPAADDYYLNREYLQCIPPDSIWKRHPWKH